MVSEVGLAAAMRPKTEYTILAPVNTAFSSELLSQETVLTSVLTSVPFTGLLDSRPRCLFVLDEVMSWDRNLRRAVLENHILKLKITLSELYNGQLLETLAGKLLRVFIYRTVGTARERAA